MIENKTAEWEKWQEAKSLVGTDTFQLGPYTTYQLLNTPRRLLFALSRYKFCAKMIGLNKNILEIGCNEGLSTYILAENAKSYYGIDVDEEAINWANSTINHDNWRFAVKDILTRPTNWTHDAAVSMDVIEHIYPENAGKFLENISKSLTEEGICIIGTPNIEHDRHASPMSRAGHVNLYSAERLEAELRNYFKQVLMFFSNDEVVHTGFAPTANYLLGVGICPNT